MHSLCAARGDNDSTKRHWNVWGKTPEIAGCPNRRGVCQEPYLHVLHDAVHRDLIIFACIKECIRGDCPPDTLLDTCNLLIRCIRSLWNDEVMRLEVFTDASLHLRAVLCLSIQDDIHHCHHIFNVYHAVTVHITSHTTKLNLFSHGIRV